MHRFIRIWRNGIVRRIILVNCFALIFAPIQAKPADHKSKEKLKCTESDPRKIYPYCMMYKSTLWCDQSKYVKIPSVKEINDHLIGYDCRTARVLFINDSCLEDLGPSDLVQFDKVTILNMEANHMTNLQRGIFSGNKQLESINARANTISKVDKDAFEGLKRLKSLNLGHNSIEELSVGTFEHTKNLEELCLDDNRLSLIQERIFRSLSKLKALRIRGNRISVIHDHAFYGLGSLTHLHLDGNRLQRVTRYTFQYLDNLEILTVSHNELRHWPTVYGKLLVNVHTLDLGYNLLDEFSSRHVSNMTKLQNLSLESNSLRKVDEDMFETTPRLGYLSLADNYLSDIPDNTFSGLCHLRHLYLHNNNLEIPRKRWWDGLSKDEPITHADLSHNRWACGCEAKEYWEFLQSLSQGSLLLALLDAECASPKKHTHRKLSELALYDFATCRHALPTAPVLLATAEVEKQHETSDCSERDFQVQPTPQPFKFVTSHATSTVTKLKQQPVNLDLPIAACLLLTALTILLLILVWFFRPSISLQGTREVQEEKSRQSNRRDDECGGNVEYKSLV